MTHVSKKKLKKDALLRIHKRFVSNLTKIKTDREMDSFLEALLTETERIMLAKRLTVIFMLTEGFSTYRIAKTLGVSVSTAIRMKDKYFEGEYDSMIDFCKKKKHRTDFWNDLDVLLRLGMPRYVGNDRWEFYRRVSARGK